MVHVSVTRLRIRSPLYMLPFIWYAVRSQRQAERAPGFLSGRLMREARNAFWTLTAWDDDEMMDAYRTNAAHRDAMPKLLDWCDEASVAHWTQESPELPSWQEAYERLIRDGRPSKVRNPSAAHLAHEFPAPRPSRVQARLAPANHSRH
jgi:heme-degrading monooxygenase HmoA